MDGKSILALRCSKTVVYHVQRGHQTRPPSAPHTWGSQLSGQCLIRALQEPLAIVSRPYQCDRRWASCLRRVQTSLIGTLVDNNADVTGASNVILGSSLNDGLSLSRLTPSGSFESLKYCEWLRKDSWPRRLGSGPLMTHRRPTKDVHEMVPKVRSQTSGIFVLGSRCVGSL